MPELVLVLPRGSKEKKNYWLFSENSNGGMKDWKHLKTKSTGFITANGCVLNSDVEGKSYYLWIWKTSITMGSQCLGTKALEREGYANEKHCPRKRNLMQCNVVKLTTWGQTLIWILKQWKMQNYILNQQFDIEFFYQIAKIKNARSYTQAATWKLNPTTKSQW